MTDELEAIVLSVCKLPAGFPVIRCCHWRSPAYNQWHARACITARAWI